ncbi:UNVERIFIED_ORG: hypothetical protein ABRZ91_002446 [Heyndrickxia coagulans]
MKKSAGGFLYCFRLFQWGGAGFESGLKNAGSLRVCFRRLVLSYRHYFPIRDGTDFQNPGLLSGFFTKRLLLKARDGSVFKSEQPACPLPALLSVSLSCERLLPTRGGGTDFQKPELLPGFLPRRLLPKPWMAVFSKASSLHTRFPLFCQSTLSCGRILSSGAKTSRWRYRFSKTAGASPPSSPSRFNKILSGE